MTITTRDIAWHALVAGDSDAPPLCDAAWLRAIREQFFTSRF